MRRLLQVRLLFVLISLLLLPAFALPFAERLRAEWARYWEPKPANDHDEWPAATEGSRAVLALLEELENRNYAQRVQAGRLPIGDMTDYPTPILPVGCLFRDDPVESNATADGVDSFPVTEEIAKQERFLRAMEEIERKFGPLEPFDHVHIGYSDAARWAEIEAESEARTKRRASAARR